VVMLIIAYTFYQKYLTEINFLKGQLAQANKVILSVKNSYQLLLEQQKEGQNLLEDRVQERTLELHVALQELEEANRELEQKNTLDELTELFNRGYYDQKILAEYRRSKRNLTPLSLIIIDVDHFKVVNDSYGHLAGDQCLIWLSQYLKESLKRSSDMAFRYGGEEFCIILPDTDEKGAIALFEILRKTIEHQVCTYKSIQISLTISAGIFTYTQQDNIKPEQIFTRADKALYEAKNNGRNQAKVYKDHIDN
jgi:diguanylate cyclase (GGDEF)-like protein